MIDAKQVICAALPRSQDDFIADGILRALKDAGFLVVTKDDLDKEHAVGFRAGYQHALIGR